MGNILHKYTSSLTLAFIDVMCGDIPFYIAAYNGYDKILWLLLSINRSINYVVTPLFIRFRFNLIYILANVHTPLFIASYLGCERVVEGFLKNDHAKHDVYMPLLFSTKNGHYKVVKLLLENRDVNINEVSENGPTLMIHAASRGYDKMVKILLEKEQIRVNQANKDGKTPLIIAAYKGHDKVVKILLEKEQICVNQADKNDQTPLITAAWEGHVKVVKMLL